MFLSQRSSVEALVTASRGYDVPLYEKFRDFKVWDEEGPPKGTLHNYPPRGDTVLSIACAPAPPKIANQMYAQATMTKLVAHCTQQGNRSTRRSPGPSRKSKASCAADAPGPSLSPLKGGKGFG